MPYTLIFKKTEGLWHLTQSFLEAIDSALPAQDKPFSTPNHYENIFLDC